MNHEACHTTISIDLAFCQSTALGRYSSILQIVSFKRHNLFNRPQDIITGCAKPMPCVLMCAIRMLNRNACRGLPSTRKIRDVSGDNLEGSPVYLQLSLTLVLMGPRAEKTRRCAQAVGSMKLMRRSRRSNSRDGCVSPVSLLDRLKQDSLRRCPVGRGLCHRRGHPGMETLARQAWHFACAS